MTVWVSTGREQVTVPNVSAGDTLASARTALEAANLSVKVDGDSSDDAIVESISPSAGTSVDKGSEVTVKTKAPSSNPSPSPSGSSSSSAPPSDGSQNDGDHGQG